MMEDYYYGWRLKPFEYISDKIVMFGFPLFGGWLPYAEFYTWWEDDFRVCQVFETTWLCRGIMITYKYSEEFKDE